MATIDYPERLGAETAEWHMAKFVEFTRMKHEVGEPSPHLAMVGYLCQDSTVEEKVWLLGCYGATYCLPSAQVLWYYWSHKDVLEQPDELLEWLTEHWPGVVTRTERRIVRTVPKFHRCLLSYANWMDTEFPKLPHIQADSPDEYYDKVFDSVTKGVYAFGRYISIRVIEGLRRYVGIPAMLYDVRSVHAWSPKKCMAYLYPEYADLLLTESKEGNECTNELFEQLVSDVKELIPTVNHYIIAAMLCEYRGAYEKGHQYVGWTIDQEPLLYDKVLAHDWGEDMDEMSEDLWRTRKAIFPPEVLCEISGAWHGTRWDVAKILRDYGYNWSDLLYDYGKTARSGDFSKPIPWPDGKRAGVDYFESHGVLH